METVRTCPPAWPDSRKVARVPHFCPDNEIDACTPGWPDSATVRTGDAGACDSKKATATIAAAATVPTATQRRRRPEPGGRSSALPPRTARPRKEERPELGNDRDRSEASTD